MKAFPASLINFVVQFLATIWLLNLMVAFLVCVIVTTPLNCNNIFTRVNFQGNFHFPKVNSTQYASKPSFSKK
jgi:hypothetical protein